MSDSPEGGSEHGGKHGSGKFDSPFHAPVLCNTVVEYLISRPSGVYVDGTLGGGGHSAALLEALAPDGRVFGVDRDPEAVEFAERRLSREVEAGRMTILQGKISNTVELLERAGITDLDGFLLDLGVSSRQLDVPERGFSYSSEGPLSMSMGRDSPISAAEIVNEWDVARLRRTLRLYGEEPRAAAIAAAIANGRPLSSTRELAELVARVVPERQRTKTLSRVFQAIRIAVNEELDELGTALGAATRLVVPGGRIVVISYHSLEDRAVKRFLRFGNVDGREVKDIYGNRIAPWRPLFGRPRRPSAQEVEANPRSRSARLRSAERNVSPPAQPSP